VSGFGYGGKAEPDLDATWFNLMVVSEWVTEQMGIQRNVP
jgi:hypothetical protein